MTDLSVDFNDADGLLKQFLSASQNFTQQIFSMFEAVRREDFVFSMTAKPCLR